MVTLNEFVPADKLLLVRSSLSDQTNWDTSARKALRDEDNLNQLQLLLLKHNHILMKSYMLDAIEDRIAQLQMWIDSAEKLFSDEEEVGKFQEWMTVAKELRIKEDEPVYVRLFNAVREVEKW